MNKQPIPTWAADKLKRLEEYQVGAGHATGNVQELWQVVAIDYDTNTCVVRGINVDTIAVVKRLGGITKIDMWGDDVERFITYPEGLYTVLR